MPERRSGATSGDHERDATRKRLLLAAGEVFAERGLQRATVRDICHRADANVAAIKYHFGGKEALYQAAFRYWFDESHVRFVQPLTANPAGTVKDRLKQFITMFLNRLLSPGKPAWHAKLMAWEMLEPTGMLEEVANTAMKPMLSQLETIIREILGPQMPRVRVERAMLSVVGQCVFYHHARPVLQLIYPHHASEPDIGEIAEHITTFTCAGLRELRLKRGRS